jgi:hypothetical protein
MAHVETWYRCPTCTRVYTSSHEAVECRNSHHITPERWAVGKYKSVRIDEHSSGRGGLIWALEEADLSDNIHERARQLEERNKPEETK